VLPTYLTIRESTGPAKGWTGARAEPE
jgi:hypothetical protein